MRILWTLISLLIFIFVYSCAEQMHSKKIIRNDIEMLYGPISLDQLYYDYPEWQQIEQQYQPDSSVIRALSEIKDKFEVKIFFATWCSDSRRELPAFFKILNASGLRSTIKTKLWAVDRKLKLDNDLALNNEIKRVATFIFYQNGKEIGRIVESPEALLLEQDVYDILTGNKK